MPRKKRLSTLILLLGCLIFPPLPWQRGVAGRFPEPVAVAQAQGHNSARAEAVLSLPFSVVPPGGGPAASPQASGRRREGGSNPPTATGELPAELSPTALGLASHWAAAELVTLIGSVDLGLEVRDLLPPDEPLTRGEFAYFLSQLLGKSGRGGPPETVRQGEAGAARRPLPFSDVPPQAPYAFRLFELYRLGLFTGTGRGQFSPERFLTRLELMAVAGRVLRLGEENFGLEPALKEGSALAAYKDEALVPGWARADVELAVAAGVIRGRPGGVLVPHVPATRAEALAVLARLLRRLPVGEAL